MSTFYLKHCRAPQSPFAFHMEAFMFLMGNPFLTAPPGSQGPIDSVQTESALCSTGEIQFPITSIGGGAQTMHP